jgi:hypothetical protein
MPGPQDPNVNPFDAIADQLFGGAPTRMKVAGDVADQDTPDDAAKILDLSHATGLPPDVVRQNLAGIKKHVDKLATPYQDILNQTPHTATLMQQPTERAAAKDDLEQLGTLEWLTNAIPRAWSRGNASLELSQLRFKDLMGDTPLTAAEHRRIADLKQQTGEGGALGTEGHWFRGALAGSTEQLPLFLGSFKEGFHYGLAGQTLGLVGAVGGGILGGLVAGPPGIVGGALEGATALTAAGGEAGFLVGNAKFAFETAAGQSYEALLNMKDELGRPLDPKVARVAAIAAGMANGVLMTAGTRLLLKGLPGADKLVGAAGQSAIETALKVPRVRSALLQLAGQYGKTLTLETINMVGQRAVQILAEEAAKVADTAQGGLPPPPEGDQSFFREDGTQKGEGFFGNLRLPTGVASEFSIADSEKIKDKAGKYLDYPSLVPTLTVDEVKAVMAAAADPTGKTKIPGSVYTKAEAFALERQKAGLPFFAQPGEANTTVYPELERLAAGRTRIPLRSPMEIAADLVQSGLSAAQSFALLTLPGPTGHFLREVARAHDAGQVETWLLAVGKGVEKSATAKRAPAVVEQLLAQATQDGPHETLYAPIDDWTTYWQSKGVDPAEMATRVTGDRQAYQQALDGKTELAIPTAKYAVTLAGTEHNAHFAKFLRLDPSLMNADEAARFQQELAKEFRKPTTPPAGAPATPEQEAATAIHADQTERLMRQGLTRANAETSATVMQRWITTFARVMNQDPRDIYRRYGFTIGGPNETAQEAIARRAADEARGERPATTARAGEGGAAAGEPAATAPGGAGGTEEPVAGAGRPTGPGGADLTAVMQAATEADLNKLLVHPDERLSNLAADEINRRATIGAPDASEAGTGAAAGERPGDGGVQREAPGAARVPDAGGEGARPEPRRLPAPDPTERFVRPTPESVAARVTPEITRELERMLQEAEDQPYEGRRWHFLDPEESGARGLRGNAAGGQAIIQKGHGQADVYGDILTYSPLNPVTSGERKGELARGGKWGADAPGAKVVNAIRDLLAGKGVKNNLGEGALRVAERRAINDYSVIERPMYPPHWGTDATPDFVATVQRLIDAVDDPTKTLEQGGVGMGVRFPDQPAGGATGLDAAPAERKDGALILSAARPTETQNTPYRRSPLTSTLASFRALPAKLAQAAALFRSYHLLTKEEARTKDPAVLVDRAVTAMKRNLRALWEAYPADWRERAQHWYVGANRIAHELAGAHGVTVDQAVGVLAALSPQMDWFKNVSLAERVLRSVKEFQQTNPTFTPDLFADYERRALATTEDRITQRRRAGAPFTRAEEKAFRAKKAAIVDELRAQVVGHSWTDLDLEGKAVFLRAVDERTPRDYSVISPEGDRPDLARTASGAPAAIGWGTYNFIANAISIALDGSPENISARLGIEHKVRSFFNNVSHPFDPRFVTIDTHAVAAAFLHPFSGDAEPVRNAMGMKHPDGGSVPQHAPTGLSGTNGIIAQAYFDLAHELGVDPRALQSVTWEAVRGLFEPGQKRGAAGVQLGSKIDALFKQYERGKISHAEFVTALHDAAGGFVPPAWVDYPVSEQGALAGASVLPRRPELSAGPGGGGVDSEGAAGARPAERDGVLLGPVGSRTFEQGPPPDQGGLFDHPPTDTLDTGEQQPRLPGAEGVRDENVPTPAVAEAPFSLTAEIAQRAAKQKTLFQGPPHAPIVLYQGVYHGSPHLFDRFDITKVGTGEGAQVYGWGLYFASRKEAAQWYRENLAGKPRPAHLAHEGVNIFDENGLYHLRDSAPGDRLPKRAQDPKLQDGLLELNQMLAHDRLKPGPEGLATARTFLEAGLARDKEHLKSFARENPNNPDVQLATRAIKRGISEKQNALAVLDTYGDKLTIEPPQKPGRLYHVELPDDATFLNWDKPLHEQDPKVLEILDNSGLGKALGQGHYEDARDNFLRDLEQAVGPDKAPEAVALATRLFEHPEELRPKQADDERTYLWLHQLTKGTNIDLNRILDIDRYGIDQHYVESVAERMMDERARTKADDYIDQHADDAPGSDLQVKEGKDKLSYDVVDSSGHVYDSFETEEEAQTAADDARQRLEDEWQQDAYQFERNRLNVDDYRAKAREQLGVGAGPLGFLGLDRGENTGEVLYQKLANAVGPENASRQLAALGINGIKYLDQGSRAAGEGSHNYVVFDDRLLDITKYEQRGDQPRGSLSIGPNRELHIQLLEGKDLSTYLHENAHGFLEVMGDLVAELQAAGDQGRTPEQQKFIADYGELLKFMGVTERSQIGTPQHEKLARAFEAYLHEGKAPSVELRGVFHTIKGWMLDIYKSLKELNVTLTPEVRGVFDRLLASEDAIKQAQEQADVRPLFTTAAEAGMSPEAFAKYRDVVAQASAAAQDELDRQTLGELQRKRTEWWRAEADVTRQEVLEAFNDHPIYRALALIKNGDRPDGTPITEGEEGIPIKLAKADLADYPPEVLAALRKHDAYRNEGGVAPEALAELTGFSSADELVQAIAQSPRFEVAVEAEVASRMQQKHGDMLLDGTLPAKAEAAVFGVGRQRVVEAELKALTSELVRGTIPPREAIRAHAEERIRGTRIRDLKPGLFLAAAQRASAKAFELLSQGRDRVGAVQAKQQELVNLTLYREAMKALDEVQVAADYLRGFDRKTTRSHIGKAGGEYLDRIDSIRARFDFTKQTLRRIDSMTSLDRWAQAQAAAHMIPLDLPDEVLNESRRTSYKNLTLEELRGVRDAVKQIAHFARLKDRLLENERKRNLAEVSLETTASIIEHAKKTMPQGPGGLHAPGTAQTRRFATFLASHIKLATFLREMDGFKDAGPLWEHVMRKLNIAGDNEAVANEKATIAVGEIFDAYKGQETTLHKPLYIHAIDGSLSRAERLMVALNWGNEGNRQRLRDGYHWTNDQVEAILHTLDARDVKVVNELWAHLESYWPDIAAKQRRVTGIVPAKVVATPFQTLAGDFTGGYFPLKYEGQLSARAAAHVDATFAEGIKQASYNNASTDRGHTKARLEHVELPVRLDLGVITQHLNQVIHDLTHHEALMDVSRLLGHKDVQQAIYAHYGDITYGQIKGALRDIGFGSQPAPGWYQTINSIRANMVTATLGLNVVTSLMHSAQIGRGMARVGVAPVLKGLSSWLSSAKNAEGSVAWIEQNSDMMRLRWKTQQRELNEVRNQVGLNQGKVSAEIHDALAKLGVDPHVMPVIADSYYYMIRKIVQFAEIPTFLGAYEKAMKETNANHEKSIQLANQAVIDSMGSGMVKDLSQVQRGGMGRVFTTFYDYHNAVYNQVYELVKASENPGRKVVDASLLLLAPIALGTLIHTLTGPSKKKKRGESDWALWAKELGGEGLDYGLNFFVGARELSGALTGRSYAGPAGLRMFNTGRQFIYRVGDLTQEEFENGGAKAEKKIGAALKATNELAGELFGYPARQVDRTAEGINAVMSGKSKNYSDIVFGPRK